MTKLSDRKTHRFHAGVGDARCTPIPSGQLSASVFERGRLDLRFYAPTKVDQQTPHNRDELYIVVAGHGQFRLADEVVCFKPGDALFVPAGAEHRFEEFTTDFATWVSSTALTVERKSPKARWTKNREVRVSAFRLGQALRLIWIGEPTGDGTDRSIACGRAQLAIDQSKHW